MIIIISSSKSMNESYNLPYDLKGTNSILHHDTSQLINHIQKLSSNALGECLKITGKLEKLNYERFQKITHSNSKEKSAAFLYSGDVFKYLNIESLTQDQNRILQKKVRIISGLYGILRPRDLIKPYRLEMQSRLPHLNNIKMSNFWQTKITNHCNDELSKHQNSMLLSLASEEYQNAISTRLLKYPMYNVIFLAKKNNELKNIGIVAKKMRGLMLRFIIDNNIDRIEDIKKFNMNNFSYNSTLSHNNKLVFSQNQFKNNDIDKKNNIVI